MGSADAAPRDAPVHLREAVDPDLVTVNDEAPSRAAWATLGVVCTVCVLLTLNMNTLSIALPTVAKSLGANALESSWLMLSYTVTMAALLLGAGRLSDLVDHRRLYLTGIAIFVITALLAGCAPDVRTLIALRVAMAIGGAILMASSAVIIHATFPSAWLGTAMGLYSTSFPAASLLGPVVGGVVVQLAGWRWVFWFNAPIAALALVGGLIALPKAAAGSRRRGLDVPGNAVLIVTIVLLTGGLSLASDLGWRNVLVWGALVVAALAFALLVVVERRAAQPVVDLLALAHSRIGWLCLASFVNAIAFFSLSSVASIYLQGVMHVDPSHAGVLALPQAVASIAASIFVGFARRRWAAILLSACCAAVGTVGALLAVVAFAEAVTWLLVVAMCLVGAAMSGFIAAISVAIIELSGPGAVGKNNGLRLMMQEVGWVVGLAIVLGLLTGVLPEAVRRPLLTATLLDRQNGEVRPGFLAAAGFMVLAALACTALLVPAARRRPARGDSANPVVARDAVPR